MLTDPLTLTATSAPRQVRLLPISDGNTRCLICSGFLRGPFLVGIGPPILLSALP